MNLATIIETGDLMKRPTSLMQESKPLAKTDAGTDCSKTKSDKTWPISDSHFQITILKTSPTKPAKTGIAKLSST